MKKHENIQRLLNLNYWKIVFSHLSESISHKERITSHFNTSWHNNSLLKNI